MADSDSQSRPFWQLDGLLGAAHSHLYIGYPLPGRDAVAGGEWRGLGLTAPVWDRGISLLMQSEPTYHACMAQTIASHIEIRPNRDGQDRAFVDGTRVRVHDVAVLAELHGQTPDQIAEALPHLSLAQIHAALSYYFDHRVEIQQ